MDCSLRGLFCSLARLYEENLRAKHHCYSDISHPGVSVDTSGLSGKHNIRQCDHHLLDLQLFRGHREHYANLTRTFAKELRYVSGYLMMEWYTHHSFFYSTSSIWLCIWNLPLRLCPWCQGLGIAHPVSCDVDMSSLLNWIKTETKIRKISRSNLAHTKHCSMYDINYRILFKRNAGCKRKNCQILSPRFSWLMSKRVRRYEVFFADPHLFVWCKLVQNNFSQFLGCPLSSQEDLRSLWGSYGLR